MKVADLHCDTMSQLRHAMQKGNPKSFGENDMHIDLQKLKKGDYMLQCFAAFVYLHDPGSTPLESALEQIDIFYQTMDQYSDDIMQVKAWSDLEQAQDSGKIGAMLTLEDGGACMGNLSVLRTLYRLGVRIVTLTWNFENELGYPNQTLDDGRMEADETHGLKDKGIEFIEEMERLGMIVDVSHLSDAGFWDVAKHTTRPFIASHSNARARCHHVRNLTDDMIRTISERGGIAGINYCADFLDDQEDEEKRFSTVSLMADHIEYIRQKGGLDMIALGSDFDGISNKLEMKDCSYLPMLEVELHRRHYSDDAIEKIFHGNVLRLLKEFLD